MVVDVCFAHSSVNSTYYMAWHTVSLLQTFVECVEGSNKQLGRKGEVQSWKYLNLFAKVEKGLCK